MNVDRVEAALGESRSVSGGNQTRTLRKKGCGVGGEGGKSFKGGVRRGKGGGEMRKLEKGIRALSVEDWNWGNGKASNGPAKDCAAGGTPTKTWGIIKKVVRRGEVRIKRLESMSIANEPGESHD